jgi:hypothetical protein
MYHRFNHRSVFFLTGMFIGATVVALLKLNLISTSPKLEEVVKLAKARTRALAPDDLTLSVEHGGLAANQEQHLSSVPIVTVPLKLLRHLSLPSLTMDHKILPETVEALGLSTNENEKLNNLLSRVRREVEKHESEAMDVIHQGIDSTVFVVKGDALRAEKERLLFEQGVRDILPSWKAEAFLESSRRSLTTLDGDFGRLTKFFKLQAHDAATKEALGKGYGLDIICVDPMLSPYKSGLDPAKVFDSMINSQIARHYDTFDTLPSRYAHLIEK